MKANETQIFYQYLLENTCTCSMASEVLGIKQKNLCRYKKELQDLNLLWEVDYKHCEITGYKAQWLTCNADLIHPIDKAQLSLFKELIGGSDV